MMRAFVLALVALLTGAICLPLAQAQFVGYGPAWSIFGNNATPEGVPSFSTSAQVRSLTIGPTSGTATSANDGHLIAAGSTNSPTISGCGTPATSSFATGGDLAGLIQFGNNAAGCVLTFKVAYTNRPICSVDWESNLATMKYVATNGGITFFQTPATGDIVDYICIATSGG